MRLHRFTPLMLALSLGACAPDFDPPSLLVDLRVLALVADPIELGPGQTVTIDPVVHVPAGQTLVKQSWSVCPFSAGSVAGFACAVPRCETPLSPASDGSITARPDQLVQSCLVKLSGSGGIPGNVPGVTTGTVPTRIELIVRYRAGVGDGFSREAVARVPYYPGGAPASPNRPPVISGVSLGGTQVSASTPAAPVVDNEEVELRVKVDPASLEDFLDASGRERTEEAILSFYATAGRLKEDLDSGTDVSMTWRVGPPGAGQSSAKIYVVARDLRGGQAAFGPLVVPVKAAP